MFAPQTEIKKITDNCCLFMCYLFCMGIEPENASSWLVYLSRALENGLVDDECTVLDAQKLLFHVTGKKYAVEKKEIKSLAEVQKMAPVRFDYNGLSHWVVVEEGKIVFNSLLNSNCVNKGKPTTARIIRLEHKN